MKFECMSLVCRMVKVFFTFGAAESTRGRTIVALAAAARARNARRERAVFMVTSGSSIRCRARRQSGGGRRR
jgi:hypothetical protein